MNKKIVFCSLFLGSSCSLSLAQEKPNIVFILADDLGYGDLSSLNAEGKIKTPNIDRMTQMGATFLDAHSSSAVSTPSRYGILTGRYNWRSRLKEGVLVWYDQPLINPERTTMASMLRNQGYKTACFGKWHLGMSFATKDGRKPLDTPQECNVDFSKEIKGGPCDVGFDYYFGVDVPNYPPYCFIENRRTIGTPTVFMPVNYKMDTRAGRALVDWNLENVLPAIVDKTVSYIKDMAERKQPFFLYMPLTSPHTPIVPTKDFQGESGLNIYADYVMQTDAAVGCVLKALEEKGILENTIVVFTSDNGCSPVANFEELEQKGHDPSYIFRGMKSDSYEGGHHIPCIVIWPERIRPHQVKQTICLTDFMATFASLTDYKLSDNEAEDSYDISALLLNNKEKEIIRNATVHHSVNGEFSIRQGKWKLILSAGSGGWSNPRSENKAALVGLPKVQLYNLDIDPSETQNLEAQNPDIVKELHQLLQKYIMEGRSTPGISQQNDGGNEWKQVLDIL